MTALVFNCHFNGLAIIQDLGRRGVPVLALDHKRSVGTVSRYARFVRCPDPLAREKAFIAFLLDLAPRFDSPPVLFPTNDHWAVAVARHKAELSHHYRPCVAASEVVELLIRKADFYAWAQSRGYPVPATWRADDWAAVPVEAFPVVAKPDYRRISGNIDEGVKEAADRDRLRLTVLDDRRALESFVREHKTRLSWLLIQEYVRGLSDAMYTIGVYADRHHNVLGMFTGRKLRGFPPDAGDCILGQSEQVPEALVALVLRLCREIRFEGIGEFEFKRDALTGVYRLIEINPRSWSWIGITPACGVSLSWLAYCDLSGLTKPAPPEMRNGPMGTVKWVRLTEDFLNCLYRNRVAGFPEWRLSPAAWWRSLSADRLVTAEFAWDDLRPGIHEVRRNVQAVLRSVLRRLA